MRTTSRYTIIVDGDEWKAEDLEEGSVIFQQQVEQEQQQYCHSYGTTAVHIEIYEFE